MPNIQVKIIFHRVLVHKRENLLFFQFWRPFWYEKGPIDLYFSNCLQNSREISFKMVLLTLYLSFHLNPGKIFFFAVGSIKFSLFTNFFYEDCSVSYQIWWSCLEKIIFPDFQWKAMYQANSTPFKGNFTRILKKN